MDVSIHRIQLQNKQEFHVGQLDMGSTKLLIQLTAAVLACTNNYSVPNVSGNIPPNWVWVMFVTHDGIEYKEN